MTDDPRQRFLRRMSTVGFGVRESLQVLVGGVVCDIRDQIQRSFYADDELDSVIAFHDDAEHLWQEMMTISPPLEREVMAERIRGLWERCTGPLLPFGPRLEHGVEVADRFARQRVEPSDPT